MKRYNFRIIHVKLSEEEKRQRVRVYNRITGLNESEAEFIKQDITEDYIEMKCLKCKYEETAEADMILECFDPKEEAYPCYTCPHCEEESFVPKDVYDQIKGNFQYK